MVSKLLWPAALAGILFASAGVGPANAISFSGSAGTGLLASADFEIVGGNLVITLTNTSQTDVLIPSSVLTAVFFDVGPALTPVSALLKAGSTVLFGSDGGGNMGGEWAYATGISGTPGGATEGISSAGFGLFGDGNFPPATNLDDPAAVNGGNYGITSAGDDPTTGNAPVTGDDPLIRNAVVFTLSCTPAPCTDALLGGITNVAFQYGTALSDPSFVPEPGTLILLGTGLVGFGAWGRRRLRKGRSK